MLSALLLLGLGLTPVHPIAPQTSVSEPTSLAVESNPQEVHLKNVRQLTFGGQNAEAYWSKDGNWIIYQALQPGYPDEQVFVMRADGSGKRLVSTGKGRCTCSYFSPDNRWLYFSSTHERNEGPQEQVDMSKGYVWRVNPDYALYRVTAAPILNPRIRMKSVMQAVIKKDGYVAETTIAPNGKYMVYCSDFEGDLEIYRANLDGSNPRRLTNEIGYDGGPFVSWDSKYIVYRRQPEASPAQQAEYKSLLKEHLVRPSHLEIWVMDADGKNKRQVTKLGKANFAPFMQPDGKHIVFSSNHADPKSREFDVYRIKTDGTGLERITYTAEFDGFPMFSRDGKKIVFASNRYGKVKGETNIFVADWVE